MAHKMLPFPSPPEHRLRHMPTPGHLQFAEAATHPVRESVVNAMQPISPFTPEQPKVSRGASKLGVADGAQDTAVMPDPFAARSCSGRRERQTRHAKDAAAMDR